jgi:hypothetical protein
MRVLLSPAVLLLCVFLASVLSVRGAAAQELAQAAADIAAGDCRRFGAVGDGETDDTEAIQAAIDSGAGRIMFPKGVYRITRPIVIELDRVGYTSLDGFGVARIEMAGAGPAFRFVGTHFGSAAPGCCSGMCRTAGSPAV